MRTSALHVSSGAFTYVMWRRWLCSLLRVVQSFKRQTQEVSSEKRARCFVIHISRLLFAFWGHAKDTWLTLDAKIQYLFSYSLRGQCSRTRTIKAVDQRSLLLCSDCNLRCLIRASQSEVLSDPPGVTAKPSQRSLQPPSDPSGPALIDFHDASQ